MENFRVEGIQKALQPPKVEKSDRAKGNEAPSKIFKPLEFSSQGEEVRAALKSLHQSPDIREDKIKHIEEAIRQGQYEQIGDLLAEKILQRIFNRPA